MLLISALFHRNLFEKYKIVEVTISRFSHIFLTHLPVKDNNESNKHIYLFTNLGFSVFSIVLQVSDFIKKIVKSIYILFGATMKAVVF